MLQRNEVPSTVQLDVNTQNSFVPVVCADKVCRKSLTSVFEFGKCIDNSTMMVLNKFRFPSC